MNYVYYSAGCANPSNLDQTALIDTGALLSLLKLTAPGTPLQVADTGVTIIQPSGKKITLPGYWIYSYHGSHHKPD